jgi:PAS domain S-box-containing protein
VDDSDYSKLSKAQLIERLNRLEKALDVPGGDEGARLVHDLQVHKIELEMQNRALREAQHDLEESRNRYAELYDLAPIGYLTLNRYGRVLDVNLTGAALLGDSREGVLSRPLTTWLEPQQSTGFHRHLEEVLTSGERRTVELRLREVPSGCHVVRLESVPAVDVRERRPDRIWSALSDVTERVRMEDRLRHQAERLAAANQRKNEFLAMLGHELRNPLAPIRNVAALIRLRAGADAGLRAAGETVERQVEHMRRLIEDLLDVSRIVRGKVHMQTEPLDLAEVARQAVEAMREEAEEAGRQLTVTLPAEPMSVEGDPVRLTQVVCNLLGNAAKFTNPGGHIELALARADGEAVLRVRDDGIGMPEQLLPRVFELFAQADHSLARPRGGLGLGLTLVHSLVRMHGGRVEALSEGPGKGSELTVHLPLLVESTRPRPGASSPSGMPRSETRAREVLVVDDNPDVADSLGVLLEAMGYGVTLATDGEAALELARSAHPDVVLLDIGMPGMDGYEVARRLRRQHPDLRLVALTGYGLDEDRRRARAAGFDFFIVKPADPETLEAVLGGQAP